MPERFRSPLPPPEGIDRELLTILVEECAEVQQRATKALRFGLAEVQPGQPHDNAARLAHEVGDLLEMVDRLCDIGVIRRDAVQNGRRRKRSQLKKFLQCDAPELFILVAGTYQLGVAAAADRGWVRSGKSAAWRTPSGLPGKVVSAADPLHGLGPSAVLILAHDWWRPLGMWSAIEAHRARGGRVVERLKDEMPDIAAAPDSATTGGVSSAWIREVCEDPEGNGIHGAAAAAIRREPRKPR